MSYLEGAILSLTELSFVNVSLQGFPQMGAYVIGAPLFAGLCLLKNKGLFIDSGTIPVDQDEGFINLALFIISILLWSWIFKKTSGWLHKLAIIIMIVAGFYCAVSLT